MRRYIIAAVAAASLVAAVSAANAGYYLPNGFYVTTCGWVFNGFGWTYVCG
jgi:hypothetical protein